MNEPAPKGDDAGCGQPDEALEPLALEPLAPLALLARGVAHDFNNLLLVMMLYADLIARKNGDGGDDAEAREIRRAVERGRRLTRQLQTYAGSFPVSRETLDPGEMLGDLEAPLRQAFGDRFVLDMQVPETGLWPVSADRGHLEEAVLALAGEARWRMRPGGTFTVEAGNRTMADGGPVPPGDYVSIRLADDGAPVPRAHLARIFEPYYASRQLGTGTGLGLAVSRAIAARAGGSLEVERGGQGGMVFTLLLPRDVSA